MIKDQKRVDPAMWPIIKKIDHVVKTANYYQNNHMDMSDEMVRRLQGQLGEVDQMYTEGHFETATCEIPRGQAIASERLYKAHEKLRHMQMLTA
jgi:hypothetical protein